MREANIQTELATRITRRLGRHWAHRFEVEWLDEDACRIRFPEADCELVPSAEHLRVRLRFHGRPEDPGALEGVVVRHLQTMAGDESLLVSWRTLPDEEGQA